MPEPLHPFHPLMLRAIELARQARRQTRPNPCVGALLVRDGNIVASGWHKGPGQPHAEVEALKDAAAKGIEPSECTMVVTLEPCRHYGKTPPCTEAVLKAGIRHVVIGALDPNPEASGGADILSSAGVRVETGIALDECLDLIDDFITWQTTDLPYTLLKLASTLDGRIATRTGHSRWVSSPESRKKVHILRSTVQAILVGGNTFYKDDPQLTCRLEDSDALRCEQPVAVIVTSRLPDANDGYFLLRERPESTIFWTNVEAASSKMAEALRRKRVRVLGLPFLQSVQDNGADEGLSDLHLGIGLRYLRREHNCQYVLCEGGGKLGLSLLEAGLVHEMHLHLAPKILGDNAALPLFDGSAPSRMDDALPLRVVDMAPSGGDVAITLRPPRRPESLLNPTREGQSCSLA